jgi:hypothetical protein
VRLGCRLRYERGLGGYQARRAERNNPGREAKIKSIHRTRPEGPTGRSSMPVLETSPDALHCLTLPLRAGLLPVSPSGLVESHYDRSSGRKPNQSAVWRFRWAFPPQLRPIICATCCGCGWRASAWRTGHERTRGSYSRRAARFASTRAFDDETNRDRLTGLRG